MSTNFRSTTKGQKKNTLEEDLHPKQQVNVACELFCFATLADTNTCTLYTDLTGKFSMQSFQGHQYIFCAYAYNANTILIHPLKTREAVDQEKVFREIYGYLQSKGFALELHIIDNKSSIIIENFVKNVERIKMKFVESDTHCVNATERAI